MAAFDEEAVDPDTLIMLLLIVVSVLALTGLVFPMGLPHSWCFPPAPPPRPTLYACKTPAFCFSEDGRCWDGDSRPL